MKTKIKLTDLRKLESSKEDLQNLKGGGGEEGPMCRTACSCQAICYSNESYNQAQKLENELRNVQNGSATSWGMDVGVTILTGAIIGILL